VAGSGIVKNFDKGVGKLGFESLKSVPPKYHKMLLFFIKKRDEQKKGCRLFQTWIWPKHWQRFTKACLLFL